MDDSFKRLMDDEHLEDIYMPTHNPKIEYNPDGPDQFEPYEPEFVSNSVEYVPTYVPSSSHQEDTTLSCLMESDSAIDLTYVPTDNYNDSGDSNDSYDVLAMQSDEVLFVKPDLPGKVIKEEPFLACEQNNTQEDIHFDHSRKALKHSSDEGSAAVAELLDFMPKKVKSKGAYFDQHEGPHDEDHIQILEERVLAIRQERIYKKKEKKKCSMRSLFGVGDLVSELRGTKKAIKEEESGFRSSRLVLDSNGHVLSSDGSCRRADGMKEPLWLPLQDLIKLEMEKRPIKPCILEQIFDLPPTPEHPKRVEDIRKLVRSKMPRCKVCKCRFGERVLLEFHLKKAHPDEYLEFILEQEKDAQAQKEHEIQQNRLEELYCGGFIPPEEDYMAENVKHEVAEIPLPGELSANGKPAHVIDRWGTISQPRFKFKKKVSPQCPLCDKRFRNDISLKKHLYKKHPEIENMDQCLRCFKITVCDEEKQNHDCDMSFLCFECNPIRNMCTAVRLANHRGKFHRGANSGFRCNECNQKFLTPRKLRKHKKMTHVFTKTYPCHFCEELFTNEVGVMTHERIHTGIVKFECQICDYKCNRYVDMECHKKEEHGYMCAICMEKYGEWSEIKNHTLIEHGGYLTEETVNPDPLFICLPHCYEREFTATQTAKNVRFENGTYQNLPIVK